MFRKTVELFLKINCLHHKQYMAQGMQIVWKFFVGSTGGLNHAIRRPMLNKLTLLMAMAALLAGPVQLSARPCVLINAPSEKACQPACCANKTCCDTSHRNTGATSQPFAKNQSDQQPTATFFAIVKQPLP